MSDPIRIVIADDHPIFRHGLRKIIEADAQLVVVAEASDGDEVLHAMRTHQPAVVVLDLTMPGKDGFDVARALRDERLPVQIVVLTMHKDEHYLRAALDLGAKGYVPKDSAVLEIRACIKAVAAGQMYVSPTLTSLLVRRLQDAETLARENPAIEQLTANERRILKLIGQGLTSRAIAEVLLLSPRTIEHHRQTIATKLGLQGSHALVRFAAKHASELG
jgi:DNA-binding NarL/FixJ family response regulator